MNSKQHTPEQPMGQRKNGNQKVSWDKWKWEYNTPSSLGYKKSFESEVYSELPTLGKKEGHKKPVEITEVETRRTIEKIKLVILKR